MNKRARDHIAIPSFILTYGFSSKEDNKRTSTLFKKNYFKNNAQMDMLRHHPTHQRNTQQRIIDRTQPHRK